MKQIHQQHWAEEFGELLSRGFDFFDFLTAYERDGEFELVARVVNTESKRSQLLLTKIASDSRSIKTLTVTYPGAVWHERETSEMFGISFTGLIDDRPLLRRSLLLAPPMLKSSVLATRMLKPWPGRPSHRKQQPIGVVENWLQI